MSGPGIPRRSGKGRTPPSCRSAAAPRSGWCEENACRGRRKPGEVEDVGAVRFRAAGEGSRDRSHARGVEDMLMSWGGVTPGLVVIPPPKMEGNGSKPHRALFSSSHPARPGVNPSARISGALLGIVPFLRWMELPPHAARPRVADGGSAGARLSAPPADGVPRRPLEPRRLMHGRFHSTGPAETSSLESLPDRAVGRHTCDADVGSDLGSRARKLAWPPSPVAFRPPTRPTTPRVCRKPAKTDVVWSWTVWTGAERSGRLSQLRLGASSTVDAYGSARGLR